MKPADLAYSELKNPKAILKKMRDLNPVDLSHWWKRQAEFLGTYNVLEAQLRVGAHQKHGAFLPGVEGSLLLTKDVEKEMQELLELDLT